MSTALFFSFLVASSLSGAVSQEDNAGYVNENSQENVVADIPVENIPAATQQETAPAATTCQCNANIETILSGHEDIQRLSNDALTNIKTLTEKVDTVATAFETSKSALNEELSFIKNAVAAPLASFEALSVEVKDLSSQLASLQAKLNEVQSQAPSTDSQAQEELLRSVVANQGDVLDQLQELRAAQMESSMGWEKFVESGHEHALNLYVLARDNGFSAFNHVADNAGTWGKDAFDVASTKTIEWGKTASVLAVELGGDIVEHSADVQIHLDQFHGTLQQRLVEVGVPKEHVSIAAYSVIGVVGLLATIFVLSILRSLCCCCCRKKASEEVVEEEASTKQKNGGKNGGKKSDRKRNKQ